MYLCRTYREQYSYRHGGRDALEVVIINLLTFHLLEGVGVQNLQQTRIPMKTIIPITMVIAAGFIGYAFWTHNVQTKRTDAGAKTVADTALAIITLPQTLSANAKIGKRSFEAKCALSAWPAAARNVLSQASKLLCCCSALAEKTNTGFAGKHIRNLRMGFNARLG